MTIGSHDDAEQGRDRPINTARMPRWEMGRGWNKWTYQPAYEVAFFIETNIFAHYYETRSSSIPMRKSTQNTVSDVQPPCP